MPDLGWYLKFNFFFSLGVGGHKQPVKERQVIL